MSVQALFAVMNATELAVDATQMAVLVQLANCAAEDGTNAWPSVATLAARSRLSERAVSKALRSLEAARVIRPTRISNGRRPTVYAINMGLLAASVSVHVRPLGEGAPDFDAPDPRTGKAFEPGDGDGSTLHHVQGCEAPTLHHVPPTLHQVQGNPARGAPEPVKNYSRTRARQGARDPDGRAPSSRRERGAGRPARGDGQTGDPWRTDEFGVAWRLKGGASDGGHDGPGRGFEIWGALVAALVARREADAVRGWIAGPGVVEIVALSTVVVVARGAVGSRAREVLEPILQRHGWRVVEAGTDWMLAA